MTPLFHLAFLVSDLEQTRQFYKNTLGAQEGRSTDTWVDFSFHGHQLSCHLGKPVQPQMTGEVAGTAVPMPHFGVILPMTEWQALADTLEDQNFKFIYPPTLRFAGEPGEQGTFFIQDPSGNAIEIKGFSDMAEVYAT